MLLRRDAGIRELHLQLQLAVRVGRGDRDVVVGLLVLDVLHDLRVERHVVVGVGGGGGEGLHVGDRGAEEGGVQEGVLLPGRVGMGVRFGVGGVGARGRGGGGADGVGAEMGVWMRVEVDEALDVCDGDGGGGRLGGSFRGAGDGGGVRAGRGGLGDVFAVRAVFDDQADGFFDAHPVELLGDGGGRLVDAAVLLLVHHARDLVLPLRVGDDFFVLEHEAVGRIGAVRGVAGQELVVRRGAAEAAFLRAVRPRGVFAVFEVEADFVEAFFGDKVFAVGAEVAAVDDGVDEVVGVGAQRAAAFDPADAFEAEGVPDAAGGDVGFVDEVEDRVGVALEGLLAGC